MKYELVSIKEGWFVPKAAARNTVVAEMVIGPVYNVEAAVGLNPFVV